MIRNEVKLGLRVNTHDKGFGTIIGFLKQESCGVLVELDESGIGHNADNYKYDDYHFVKMPDKKDRRYYYFYYDYLTLLEHNKLIFNYLIL